MAQSQFKSPIDEATYARLSKESEARLELIGGQIVAMAGASWTHNKLSTRIATALNANSGEGNCEATVGDLRIRVEATGENFYPDVVMACDDAEFHETLPHTLLNPVVAVEVLSPTTQNTDLDGKLTAYQSIPSLQHYLIFSQNRVRALHYARASETRWDFRAYYWRRETLALESLQLSIVLGEIYRNLTVPEGLTLVPSSAP